MSRTIKFYNEQGKVLKLKVAIVAWRSASLQTLRNCIAFAGKKGFVYTKDGKRDTRRFVFPK